MIILTVYNGPSDFMIRQLALARLLGTRVVRWWVGTDVMKCLDNPLDQRQTNLLNRFLSVNVAVSPHLVDELLSIGIKSQYIASVTTLEPPANLSQRKTLPKSVLVYLPTNRKEFYGGPIVRSAISNNPDVQFLIVADESHSLAKYSNVKSLGWVGNMSDVWDEVGILLRVTQHDGMPRMVLDALQRGKHVIFSWSFPGCVFADSEETVNAAIHELKTGMSVNNEGIAAVEAILNRCPARQFDTLLRDSVESRDLGEASQAFLSVLFQTLRVRWTEMCRKIKPT
nr:glycosyltransferase family 4 protein [Rhodopirellula sp. SM50]